MTSPSPISTTGRDMTPIRHDVSAFLLDLYRAARSVPVETFRDWMLDRLKTVIPFDKAFWGTGDAYAQTVHAAHLHNMPAELLASWSRFKDEKDILMLAIFASPGKTVGIFDLTTWEERRQGEVYRSHSSLFGIEDAIATIIEDRTTNLFTGLSLYRSDRNTLFAPEDKAIKEFLFPHLVEAVDRNLFESLREEPDGRPDAMGACLPTGILSQSEPSFGALVRLEWPDWTGPMLPEPLAALATEAGGGAHKGVRTVFEVMPHGPAVILKGRRIGPADTLTPREQDIAALYAAGRTYKEIARALDISPSTVRRHLEASYRKLEVSNKVELLRVLSPDTNGP